MVVLLETITNNTEEVRKLIMAQEKTLRSHSICRCGRTSEFQIGSRDFFIGTRKITVKKLPYFYCSYCDTASYDSNTNVDGVLKKAYKANLDEVSYN